MLEMDKIRNAQAVIERFGTWPAFHDAEIHSITLQRGNDLRECSSTCLTMEIRYWNHEPQTAPESVETIDHCIVTLRFLGLVLEDLRHFGCQNVIFELTIADIADSPLDPNTANYYGREEISDLKFKVWIDTSFGCCGSFGCSEIEVISVESIS